MAKMILDEGTMAIIRETAHQAAEATADRVIRAHTEGCPLRAEIAVLKTKVSPLWAIFMAVVTSVLVSLAALAMGRRL